MHKFCFLLFLTSQVHAQTLEAIEQSRIVLPNGWGITAVGKSLHLGDLPLNLAVSPDKKFIAVTNNGQSVQSIQLVDIAKGTIADSRVVKVAWLGLAWSDDSKTLYAQVLSDIPGGNGDTTLLLFGEKATPNQHALAKEFVLLDNFYVDGEVSADGHNWSTGAYATDYLEKTWPTGYGDRGGTYDAEGTRAIANNKNGFIWDFCKRYGVTYRTYGEFADDYKPNIPALENHFCPYYTSWDQTVMDTTRVRQWKRDFDSLLAADAVPQLNTLRLINDHTEGLKLGRPTPTAEVADNDFAVGLFVEHLSRSRIWKQSAVFIVEDDAQNGPDHVDAHRSTAYVAGGFVKRHFIDHTMYSTSGLLRTIELILGLPPMSQYDAAAEPMWRCFGDTSNGSPFRGIPPQVDLFEKNTAMNEWQRKSEQFDFGKEDRVPNAELNQVIWAAIRGDGYSCPAPKRAAFVNTDEAEEDKR